MKAIFADSSYFISSLNSRARDHRLVVAIARDTEYTWLITSEFVLVEVLNYFSQQDRTFRKVASDLPITLRKMSNVVAVAGTTELFLRSVELYRARLDKDWSLTDCSSFIIMRDRDITEALTHDHHFEQAGFAALLKKEKK